jgi:hypothetical protein
MRPLDPLLRFAPAAAFLLQACSSTFSVPDDSEEADSGIEEFEALDVEDNRDIPSVCNTVEDCNDGDPCTTETCSGGKCQFSTKGIALVPIPISTFNQALDVAFGPGVLYVAEGDAGVEAFDVSNPSNPFFAGIVGVTGDALAVDANEQGFAVSEGESGIETFSASSMNHLAHAMPGDGNLMGVEEIVSVALGPGYTVASAYSDGILILNLTSLSNIISISKIDTPGRAVSAASSKETCALVADWLGGAAAITFYTEEGPAITGEVLSDGRVVDVAVSGDTGMTAELGAGFGVIDFSDPGQPVRLASVPSASLIIAVSLLGAQTGVVADESGRVVVLDLIDALRPSVVSTWTATSGPEGMDTMGGLIALALGEQGAVLISTGCESE